MRIIVHDYAGHGFPTSLSRELAARGHQVAHAFASVLQTPRGDLRRRPGDADGLTFQEIAMDPDYPRHKYSFVRRRNMEVAYGRQAARFIRDWRPDVLISGNTPTETQEHVSRATVAAGARFCYWLQDFYSLAVDRLLRRKLPVVGAAIGAWYRHLEKAQFHRSSRIVAITADFHPILEREFGVDPARVEVVPNWAIVEELPPQPKDNPWARQHDLHDKFVFLYSGTIGMKHNPALLLDLARSFADHPEVRVVVVSEGIGSDWLRAQAAAAGLRNLVLLPYQPVASLPQVLASGDVLVGILEPEAGVFSVPSKTLSYLCAARPLLLAVPPENLAARITADHRAGLIVPPTDARDFVAAARQLHREPALRQTLAGHARAYAEANFLIRPVADRFERILSAT